MLATAATPDTASLLAEVAAGRSVANVETAWRRKDGSEVHIAMTLSPLKEATGHVQAGTAIARDITASRTAAEALRQSEERLRLIMENAREYAIFSLDLQRRVTSWNAGAQRLLGYAEDEVLGRSADVIFTPEDRAAQAPEKEANLARREGRAADDRTHVRQDGTRFPATGILMLMRNRAGEAVGFVKILRDQSQDVPRPRD
jgi:two-component system CheB/CheR fusion protein